MTDKDKIKLGIAGGILLVALVIIYWFGIRKPPETPTSSTGTPAPVAASNDPNAPPPASNRRVGSDVLKANEKK